MEEKWMDDLLSYNHAFHILGLYLNDVVYLLHSLNKIKSDFLS